MSETGKVQASRDVYPYNSLSNISWHALRRAETETEGSVLEATVSIVFTAFAMEAYLNYLGAMLLGTEWSNIERNLNPQKKLKRIGKIIHLASDFNIEPFLTFKRIFEYRNAIVHSKIESVEGEVGTIGEELKLSKNMWLDDITPDFARYSYDRCKDLRDLLFEHAKKFNNNIQKEPFDGSLWGPA